MTESTDTSSNGGQGSSESLDLWRDHLANRRTLLAWVRTAVAIMTFGFVVARFGLFLDELPGHHHREALLFSAVIGIGLVIVGAVSLVLATVEFMSVRVAINRRVARFTYGNYLFLTGLLLLVALALAGYLIATT